MRLIAETFDLTEEASSTRAAHAIAEFAAASEHMPAFSAAMGRRNRLTIPMMEPYSKPIGRRGPS